MNEAPITIITTTRLPASPAQVFDFHADVSNLPRLTPGPARIISAPRPTREGDEQVIEIGVRPFAVRWHARIERVEAPDRMVDVQERGPFRYWPHTHAVLSAAGGSVLVDMVEFRLVPGAAGRLVDATLVAVALRLLFFVRHRRTLRMLAPRRGGR